MQRCVRLAQTSARRRVPSVAVLPVPGRARVISPIARRHYAGAATPYPPGSSGYRISTVFTTMVVVAVAGTSYALYQFYTSVTTFPKSLRADLRSGIKTRESNPLMSAKYFRRAWDAARELPPSEQGDSWPKKLSGIGIALAGVLEGNGEPKEARLVLLTTWQDLEEPAKTDTGMRARRVAIATRMADLAKVSGEERVEEEWAVWAVEEMLRGGIETKGNEKAKEEGEDELVLPTWVGKAEAVSCLERLGTMYASRGNVEYAVPLYLQALSQMPLKVSPSKSFFSSSDGRATPTSLCQAAVLFNNLSELFSTRAAPGTNELKQALAWGHQGIAALREASKMGLDNADDADECRRTAVVVQTNQATLLEMHGDLRSAEVLFTSAARLADQVRWTEAHTQAFGGVRRVQKAQTKKGASPNA